MSDHQHFVRCLEAYQAGIIAPATLIADAEGGVMLPSRWPETRAPQTPAWEVWAAIDDGEILHITEDQLAKLNPKQRAAVQAAIDACYAAMDALDEETGA